MRLAFAIALMFAAANHPTDAGHSFRGYTAQNAATESEWEHKFRDIPAPDRIRANMQRLSARPHHVGSPYDKDNAEWLLAQLKSYGLDAQIETFSTLFPTPKSRLLELLGPAPYKAKLQEPALSIDPTSAQTAEQLPTYNAYSRDGDVTGPLVYVNYGRPEDYEVLDRRGVSVKGAIVLARYGESWRGIKPKVAAEHGAVGCIIFSDPKDDGYAEGEVFPAGPARPPEGVQRGSVMDMPLYPGDPQTPGIGATEGAKLIPLDQVQTITKIPVLPISYEDATPFLKALQGETVPEHWRGGLPLTYRIGPSQAKAHLAVSFNWDRKPLYDVVARIPGAKSPDQWIVRGNHHDAWVNGAEDPVSGASPELEEARALGARAHHRLLLLGRRRAGPVGIDGVGGESRGRVEAARGGLHQYRLQRSRISLRGGLAFPGDLRQRSRQGHRRSRNADERVEARPPVRHLQGQGQGARGTVGRGPTCASMPWVPVPITPRSSITWAWPA
jgi:N-acetylated-alpha-linked acidic dipeptidase